MRDHIAAPPAQAPAGAAPRGFHAENLGANTKMRMGAPRHPIARDRDQGATAMIDGHAVTSPAGNPDGKPKAAKGDDAICASVPHGGRCSGNLRITTPRYPVDEGRN